MDISKKELLKLINNMTWSYSRINSFNTCKQMWYYSYIEKYKGLGNAFSASGTFAHSILEKFAKNEIAIWDMVDIFIEDYEKEVPFKFPYNKYVDLGEKNYNNGIEYFTNFQGFDDIGEIVDSEVKVVTNLQDFENTYPFTGFIDLLLKDENGEYIVLDHKSKGKFKSKKEQAEYAKQLYVYAKYIKEHYGKFPKTLIFNMFNSNETIKIPFNKKDYDDAIYWCVDIIQQIKEEEDFEKNVDTFFCDNLCNFRNMCSK